MRRFGQYSLRDIVVLVAIGGLFVWYYGGRGFGGSPLGFAIYIVALVTRWLRDEVGGLAAQEARNREKASLLYGRIDASGGLYRGHAAPDSRSMMNVTWRLPTPELDARFVAEAAAEGLVELKGHRSVGGIRASIYNAMPLEGVRALAAFMDDFAGRNG